MNMENPVQNPVENVENYVRFFKNHGFWTNYAVETRNIPVENSVELVER